MFCPSDSLMSDRFDVALDINTKGAARIINFAKKCKKLKLYVHVSTGDQPVPYLIIIINR